MISQSALDTMAKCPSRIHWLADDIYLHQQNHNHSHHHQRSSSASSGSPTGIGSYDGLVNVFAKRHETNSDCDKEQWIWQTLHNTHRFPNVLSYICRVGNSLVSEYDDGKTLKDLAMKLTVSNKLTILWQIYTGFYHIWSTTGWLPDHMSMTDIAVKHLSCPSRFMIDNAVIDSYDFCQIYNFDHWFCDYSLSALVFPTTKPCCLIWSSSSGC